MKISRKKRKKRATGAPSASQFTAHIACTYISYLPYQCITISVDYRTLRSIVFYLPFESLASMLLQAMGRRDILGRSWSICGACLYMDQHQARVIAIKKSQLRIVDLSIFYILEGEKFRSWGVPYIFLCDNVSERFSGCGHAGTFCIFLNSSSGRWRSLTRPARHLSPLWSHGIYERAQRSDQSLFCKPANHRRLSQHYPSGRTLPVFTNWNTQCPFVQDIWR